MYPPVVDIRMTLKDAAYEIVLRDLYEERREIDRKLAEAQAGLRVAQASDTRHAAMVAEYGPSN